ncbi:hypothetical protein K445DRAFT_18713 [Daldinia sp. EC12]|nr:hypothetical protein F4774DRAFT_421336 [Daldinia eschscholtzii]OTB19109.1 hypothetical protein K445DRAFT_18713 [Daldinia sp. EC12]
MSYREVRVGLDEVPIEIVVKIFSLLPDVKSMSDFGITSKRYQNILKENESIIARRFATRIIKDIDPGVMRLAFIACKARKYEYFYYGDVQDPFDGGLDFLDTYVEHGDWPSHFYQLRVLHCLPALSKDVEVVLDWAMTHIAPFPADMEDKSFTPSEITRQRRLFYMIDFIGKFLTKSKVPLKNDPRFNVLFHTLWASFSPAEVYLAYELLTRMIHFFETNLKLLVSKKADLIIRSMFELWGYKEHMKAFVTKIRKELATGKCLVPWVPLIDDPQAFIKDRIPMNPEDDENLMDYYYYSPLDYEGLTKKYLHSNGTQFWFFLIGDKDRCQSVINRGPVWTWETGTNVRLALLGDPIVVWQQHPGRFGCSGSIGTKVPYYELCDGSRDDSHDDSDAS